MPTPTAAVRTNARIYIPGLDRTHLTMPGTLFVTPPSVALTNTARIPAVPIPISSSSLSTLRCAHLASSTQLRTPRLRVQTAVKAEKTSLAPTPLADGCLHFCKYQGLGNDFILVDNRNSMEPRITPEQAVKLCDRNPSGVGADGVILVMPGTQGTDYTMRIFNSDGSEPEMCGNGVRCVAKFVSKLEQLQGEHVFRLHTGAGLIVAEVLEDGNVLVDMGEPILKAADVPTLLPPNQGEAVVKAGLIVDGIQWTATCVSMGNPHCVVFGNERDQELVVDGLDLSEIGPKFEHHRAFPARTNTEFVQVISPSHLKMRVWERGAGATLACGTGACAAVVAAVLEGRAGRTCTVDLPGGPLEIEWREEDNHIYMTGPAEEVFCGSVPLNDLD